MQEEAGEEGLGMAHLRISVPLAKGLSGDAVDSPSAAVAAVNAAATPSALRVSSHTLHLEASEVVDDEEEEDDGKEAAPAAEEAVEDALEEGDGEESEAEEPVAADATEAVEIPAVLAQATTKASSLSPVVSLSATAGGKLGEEAKKLFQ